MTDGSIVLVGWPDSGKTNFLAALWDKLRIGKGRLTAASAPNDITYVEEALAFQSEGEFAPRSDKNIEESRRDFAVNVELVESGTTKKASLVVPDVTGELWKTAVETTEILPDWMNELRAASGAILFVRVLSEANAIPLDWVTTDRLLRAKKFNKADEAKAKRIPTQIALCEMLRFLEDTLPDQASGQPPRIAVLVTAWDLVDKQTGRAGPNAYLWKDYPMFAGRLADVERLDVQVFGMSALGGDFIDETFKTKYLKGEVSGYVVTGEGTEQRHEDDVTWPVAWVIGSECL